MKRPFPTLWVALHDVHDATLESCARDFDRLRSWGAVGIALMVVPKFRGNPLSPETAAWLREREAEGHPIFQHGLTHVSQPPYRRGAGAWARRLADGEAEFAGLERREGMRRFREGAAILHSLGLNPVGFTAPAWFGGLSLREARRAGLKWFDLRFAVRDVADGRFTFAPPLTFSPARGKSPLPYGGRLWFALLQRCRCVRLALHPGDTDHASVVSAATRLFGATQAVEYGSTRTQRKSP